jgi:hypothetical protein
MHIKPRYPLMILGFIVCKSGVMGASIILLSHLPINRVSSLPHTNHNKYDNLTVYSRNTKRPNLSTKGDRHPKKTDWP